jgi:hypothetical protein
MTALALVVSVFLSAEPAEKEPELPKLPAGWVMPRAIKRSVCASDHRYIARADFDGDGKEDVALMLTKDDHASLGVFIWLAGKKAPLQVGSFEREDGKHEMGLGVVNAGEYDTACGKGLWECKPGEPPKLTVKKAALDVYTCESASSYVYWNEKKKKFETVAMTDAV